MTRSSQIRSILMLIPSFVKQGIDDEVASDRHPRMDYYELAHQLSERGCAVHILDYSVLGKIPPGARDLSLALMGFARRRRFDAIFCNSESIALPLGSLLCHKKGLPRVVGIGHRISTPKKQLFFTRFHATDAIDTLFLYATSQQRFAVDTFKIPAGKVPLIPFHADTKFFRPPDLPIKQGDRPLVCSAGLEWRDYPTLIEVARQMPAVDFRLAAASPWSKHQNEAERAELPPNVTVRKHAYDSLRELYRASDCVAVPLYETDFQAGVTTILEAMACGKPVVTSRTQGQTDVIDDGKNGMYTPPGDVVALKQKLEALLHDAKLRQRLGSAARDWVENNASLDLWSKTIADAITG